MAFTTFTSGTTANASEVNENFVMVNTFIKWDRFEELCNGVAVDDSTTWLVQKNDGSVYRTTDSGDTYTQVDSDTHSATPDHPQGITLVGSTAMKLYRTDSSSVVRVSTDSGVNWADPGTTVPANVTAAYCLVQTSATKAWIFGDASSNHGCWYTTDSGATWTQSTTGWGTGVDAIGTMYDDSNGCAIADDNVVYKTVDGGVNWSAALTSPPSYSDIDRIALFPIASDTYIYARLDTTSYYVEIFELDFTADTSTYKAIIQAPGALRVVGSLKDGTTLVFAVMNEDDNTDHCTPMFIWSDDSGDTWYSKPLTMQAVVEGTHINGIAKRDSGSYLVASHLGLAHLDKWTA